MTHPAGWYPDPYNTGQERHWDGSVWGPYTRPAAAVTPAKKRRDPFRTILTIAGVILVIVVAVSFFAPSDNTERNSNSPAAVEAVDPDFNNPATYLPLDDRALQVLIKNPDAAAGAKHIIYGEVSQLDAATGDRTMRVDAVATPDAGGFGDNVVVNVRDAELLRPVVSGDMVKLFVVVDGAISYDTQIGGRTTVPEFTAAIVEVLPS
ncbi:DUF2510 domain-containing protein [Rhodococcus sp. NPDC057297]|uniref:DUF2510 domain-containing protein n=1 Tax=Rhodococcus sp. NPDC057297 TaxID=3346090 RepID=UPI003645002C